MEGTPQLKGTQRHKKIWAASPPKNQMVQGGGYLLSIFGDGKEIHVSLACLISPSPSIVKDLELSIFVSFLFSAAAAAARSIKKKIGERERRSS